MSRRASRIAFGLVLGLGATLGAVSADDTKSSSDTPKPPTVDKAKAPDFSGYVAVTKVTGEVVKGNESSLTLRIYWQHATVKNSSGGRGRGRRPSLHGNHGRSHYSPYMTRRPRVQVKWEHHDYDLPYLPESLVRVNQLPPKIGPDGKKGFYSQAEQDDLKVPYTVPGFQASKADLAPGTVVDAHVVRDKSIPANKVTDADMRLKYVVIIGHDPNPPADITNPPKASKKKN
jgi:hypothetical protein